MPNSTPNWLAEEETQAEELAATPHVPNPRAPKLSTPIYRKPPRRQKPIYIQDSYRHALERIVLDQKQTHGRSAPELYEEAIDLLLVKHGYPPVGD